MNAQSLPLVPFGKYKGQPITSLMNDTKYLEWCKQQEWFHKNFPIVYNICVNQTITTNNSNSKTPEHNKLQNMFLKKENVKKLLKFITFPRDEKFIFSDSIRFTEKDVDIGSGLGKIKFEGKFNWDLIVKNYMWRLCECDRTIASKSCDCEMFKRFREYERDGCCKLPDLYCEIKPSMGDDYPCVLRKMNTQIKLTKNYAIKQHYEKRISDEWGLLHDGYGIYGGRQGPIFSLENAKSHSCKNVIKKFKYVLIIKDFNSTTTTKSELTQIFEQSKIRIVFIDELFDNLSSNIQDISIHPTLKPQDTEENKLL